MEMLTLLIAAALLVHRTTASRYACSKVAARVEGFLVAVFPSYDMIVPVLPIAIDSSSRRKKEVSYGY